MATPQPHGQKPGQQVPARATFMTKLVSSLRLKMRLMGDRRVSIWLKLGLIMGSLWVIFPDMIPGWLDDIFVFSLIANWEDFCPQYVVNEIREKLEREAKGEAPQPKPKNPGNLGKKPASAEPEEKVVERPGKPTGRYLVQNKGDQRITDLDGIGDADQVWEEYEIQDPESGKTQNKWRRYR